MASKPTNTSRVIKTPSITKPKGGGSIKGIGETFQPHLFSGTLAFTIPIHTSPSRGFSPQLSLSYSSGSGNGMFGGGFSISLPKISRQTRLGKPKYDNTDRFVLSGTDDLVKKLIKKGKSWEVDKYPDATKKYIITQYRPRIESEFAKIEKWSLIASSDIHWRVTTKNNVTSIYGKRETARIYDPLEPKKVYQWLLEESFDAKGSQISYTYKKEERKNVKSSIEEKGHADSVMVYPEKIKYGNFSSNGNISQNNYHFEVVFDYGENDLDKPKYSPSKEWACRQDPFSSYKSGFDIRTYRLCKGIIMFHRFKDINNGIPFPVKAMKFTYDENPIMSLLIKSQEIGYRNENGVIKTKSMPPLDFVFSQADPTFLTNFDSNFLTGFLKVGKISEQIWKEFKFKGIDLEKNATISDLPHSKVKSWKIADAKNCYILCQKADYIQVYNPGLKSGFQELKTKEGKSIPGLITKKNYQFTDLYGDGLPGILYTDKSSVFYWEPLGEGAFNPPKPQAVFPIDHSLGNQEASLVDLDANGNPDLVIQAQQIKGFYPLDENRLWSNFRNFEQYPTDYSDKSELLDLTGDGLSDLVYFDENTVKYYPSIGKKGFDHLKRYVNTDGLAYTKNSSQEEAYRFADIFGDGTNHLVRIRNGEISCWPNLGYGKFGSKTLLNNAPLIDGNLDSNRLFLMDVDGSGTSDIIYLYKDSFAVYFNQSGNGFSDPVYIPLPKPYAKIDQIQFADILGNGTSSLVFTSINSDLSVNHEFYSFTGTKKPYLLKELNNNLGCLTRLQYASSAKFYLEDKKANNPWITPLTFPVLVVEKTETVDYFSQTKLVSRYKYHDGYYDPVDREFRGFGFIEHWDEEPFNLFNGKGLPPNDDNYVAPVYTKCWFHTGAYIESKSLINHYKESFYKSEDAYELPSTFFECSIQQSNGKTIQQAFRALHGSVLRQEVYEGDENHNFSQLLIPYKVSESNMSVHMIQPLENNPYAVFLVNDREGINYIYEKNSADPRIEHDFTLETDSYGHVIRSCTVYYGRRSNQNTDPANKIYKKEQQTLKVIAAENRYTNITKGFYLLGVPIEEQSFEIGGLSLNGSSYFTFDKICSNIKTALLNIIPFNQKVSADKIQARRLSWERNIYCDKNIPLKLGAVSAQDLLHNSASAVFSSADLKSVFGNKIPDQWYNQGGELEKNGGFVFDTESNLWWNPGEKAHYLGASGFFLQQSTLDPFGNETKMEYDPYNLLLTTVTDPLQNKTVSLPDYQTLQPEQIKDLNEIIFQAKYDPLGQLIVTSIFKTDKNGQVQGDEPLTKYSIQANPTLKTITTKPDQYLQKATSFYYYDLDSWIIKRQPVSALTILRKIHVSDLSVNTKSPLQIQLEYSDGFGRAVESKIRVDSGHAQIISNQGKVIKKNSKDRWLTTGRTVYNNKGLAIKQYEPFYSEGFPYQGESVLSLNGVSSTLYYDSLSRPIRVDTPKGFFTKKEYAAWFQKQFDENDTVKDSCYFKKYNNTGKISKAEQEALNQAVLDYDTPNIQVFDNQGRTFLDIQMKVVTKAKIKYLTTFHNLDINGNILSSIDPRLYENSKPPNITNTYSMQGDTLYCESVDAGERWELKNSIGNSIYSWDSRNFEFCTSYDSLHRPLSIHVAGDDCKGLKLDQVVERMVYGTSVDTKNNCNGRLIQQYDQSGLTSNLAYNLQGELNKYERQLYKEYQKEVDWTKPPIGSTDPRLESYSFKFQLDFNVLGQIMSEVFPDSTGNNKGNETQYTYMPEGWLQSVSLLDKTNNSLASLDSITYNPKGQINQITYGNGVSSSFLYEQKTFRLINLTTSKKGKIHQNLTYTYDPVGNITQIKDSSFKTVFNKNQQVDPVSKYAYDSLYRLITSNGRQLLGLSGNAYNSANSFKQSGFAKLNDASQLQNYTQTYTYDDAGNLQLLQHNAGQNSWKRTITTESDSNQINSYVPAGSKKPVNISYDKNGNISELQNLHLLNWNYRNNTASALLIDRSAENKPNDEEYYVYDSNGSRVRKVTQHLINNKLVIEEKVYLGEYIVMRTLQNKVWTISRESYHLRDNGDAKSVIIHQWNSGSKAGQNQIRYQYTNDIGSISMELNENADLISYEEYFPFGGTSFITGSNKTEVSTKDYRYSGKERDDSTSLYYYGARYYAPWLGRWMSPDPAWTVDGLNLYAFVQNNPIKLFDKTGLCSKKRKRPKRDAADKGEEKRRNNPESANNKRKRGGFGYSGRANAPQQKPTIDETIKAVNALGDYKKGTTRVHWKGYRDTNNLTTGIPIFVTSRDPKAWTKDQKSLRTKLSNFLNGKITQAEFATHLAELSHTLAGSLYGSNDSLNAFAASVHQNTEWLALESGVKELDKNNQSHDVRIKLTAYVHESGSLKGTLKASRFKIYMNGNKVYDHLSVGTRDAIDKDEAKYYYNKVKSLDSNTSLAGKNKLSPASPPDLNNMRKGTQSSIRSNAFTDIQPSSGQYKGINLTDSKALYNIPK